MPRLYRPHIPLPVQAKVLVRQIGYLWPDDVLKGVIERKELARFVQFQKTMLADALGCAAVDLRLDHDPALATREIVAGTGSDKATRYKPDANDPEFLIYREKHAHHIKTNVRGEGAQYPDRVLIKRERKRRLAKKLKKNPRIWRKISDNKQKRIIDAKSKHRWPSRPFPKRRKP